MFKLILFGLGLMGTSYAMGAVLATEHYVIRITPHCKEGNVTCDNVTYVGQSKRSGHMITLTGKTIHRLCSDGQTPCQFLGYEFKNSDVTYTVLESGLLKVTHNEHLLLSEHGKWRD